MLWSVRGHAWSNSRDMWCVCAGTPARFGCRPAVKQSSTDSLADHTNGDVGTACKKCSWTHGPHSLRMLRSKLAHCRWGSSLPDRPRRTPTNRRRVHSASPIKNGGSAIARTPQMLVVQLQRQSCSSKSYQRRSCSARGHLLVCSPHDGAPAKFFSEDDPTQQCTKYNIDIQQ